VIFCRKKFGSLAFKFSSSNMRLIYNHMIK